MCNIRPHSPGPMGGLKIEGLLYSEYCMLTECLHVTIVLTVPGESFWKNLKAKTELKPGKDHNGCQSYLSELKCCSRLGIFPEN